MNSMVEKYHDGTINSGTSVIIGIRDRYDYRINNALASLRAQKPGRGLLEVLLVDYGSDRKYRGCFDALCAEYSVVGVWTGTANQWNRAHCMNIGIKFASQEFVLFSDVDIIFDEMYVKNCMCIPQSSPGIAVYSDMLELGREHESQLLRSPLGIKRLKRFAVARACVRKNSLFPYGSSILFVPRFPLVAMRGFDESFKLWGCEDVDLLQRLSLCGIQFAKLTESFHLHQWHERFENVKANSGLRRQIDLNFDYLARQSSIVRNLESWGDPRFIR